MLEAAGTEACQGWFEGNVYVLPVRVYYHDTDAGGIVYHANYLHFAERNRWEMLRTIGHDCITLRDRDQMMFVVKKVEMDFYEPAALGDTIEVRSVIEKLGGATMIVRQEMVRDGKKLVVLHLKLGCVGPDVKPCRMPAALRDRLTDLIETSS